MYITVRVLNIYLALVDTLWAGLMSWSSQLSTLDFVFSDVKPAE